MVSPDEFMFRQFRLHSTILRSGDRDKYFMLSGGANLFPMSDVWKELIAIEVENDLAYGWYTPQQGFPTLQRAASLWENYAASLGGFPKDIPLGGAVSMTLGATQAVDAVFSYVAKNGSKPTVAISGFSYALFERSARHYGLDIQEILFDGKEKNRTIPSIDQLIDEIHRSQPSLLVVTVPANPSGEQYDVEDFKQLFLAASDSGSIVLVDQVSQMPIGQASWVNVGEAIAATQTQDFVVLVNSFSKTDSVPGFRIGYVMGPKCIVAEVGHYQFLSTMNPPTFPILPPFFTFIARSVFVSERLGWTLPGDRESLLSFARHMFDVTTAIAPTKVREDVERRLSEENFHATYDRYCAHSTDICAAIAENHSYILENLDYYISEATQLQGGFNFLIHLTPFSGRDEEEMCRQVFRSTGVALLTESCFRVSPRTCRNFWVRISLAAPTDQFRSAVDRLKRSIENIS